MSITEPEDAAVDIGSWLRNLGLEQHEAAFRENGVSAEVLRHLTADDLKELGVAAVGHRRQLLVAIAELRDRAPSAARPAENQLALPSSGERRQLTVMFCDLVGSTALSEKLDPEELRSLLHAYRTLCGDVIASYDGFVARYVGDGILTYFGWPSAHEEDAERAVRAALEIVHTVKRASSTEALSVRIGIATGPVVVGETAGAGDQSKLAVGSTPNLAARLQGLAAADQIVVASSTRRLIGNAFELTDLGEHELKGIVDAVHVWRVERALLTESRFDAHRDGALTPLVGRGEELDLLLGRWSQAKDGEGQVVLLSGEPGIGKSRILSALRQRLEAQGVQALRFQCSPYYVNSAFWPSIDNFERALKFARDETTDAKLDKLEALIVTQYGRPLADVRFVASILSIPCEARYGALPMTPQKYKDETLRTLVDITEAAARKQPSVMLFEDAHWADPTTLEVLDLLIDRVRTVPLLIVLTHRPEFQSRWSGQGHVGALDLSKLTRTQSAAIVSTLAGGKALPEALLEQILTRTDGVPLFVEELTKSILESGELTEADDHYEYAGSPRAVTIPATLRDSLMARLDRFMPVKEIAQIGAAIGREFSYELISAVAPIPQAQLDDALRRLGESGLAFRRGTPPDAVYSFKHALVRDAAYESLLKSRRHELHAKIARVIEKLLPATENTEPELLAHHYTEAKEFQKAIPLWHKAGKLGIKQLALAESIRHLDKGLDQITGLPQSVERDGWELDLRTALGTAWIALRGWQAQTVWDSLFPAMRIANSLRRGDAMVPILWGLYTNVLTTGRVEESLRWAARIVEVAEAYSRQDLLMIGRLATANSYFWLGELIKAREHTEQVLSLYQEEQHSRLVDILNHDPKTFGLIRAALLSGMLGYYDQAIEIGHARDSHARKCGHPFDLGFTLTEGAWIYDHLNEPDEQLKRAAEAEQLARENSLLVFVAFFVPVSSGIASIRKAQFGPGTKSLKTGISVWEEIGGRLALPYLRSVLAYGTAQAGDVEGALCLVDEVVEQVERPGWGERWYYAETLRIKGWLLSLKGDLEGAERSYLASLDWARRQQAKSWELRTSTSLARLWHSQGKCRDAHDLLAPVYDWFTEGFDTKDLQEAKALLDEIAMN